MVNASLFIHRFAEVFSASQSTPWHLPSQAEQLINEKSKALTAAYKQSGNVFIHESSIVEPQVTMKGPIIIGPGCFIGAHAYLRGGVYLEENVVIGPGCEVKSSFLFKGSALAHFNFAGDSIIGEGVNMEAGSILANHYNERDDKTIRALIDKAIIILPVTKFGSLVGDHSKIGANAVLSPGTVLPSRSVVKRLELIEQVKG